MERSKVESENKINNNMRQINALIARFNSLPNTNAGSGLTSNDNLKIFPGLSLNVNDENNFNNANNNTFNPTESRLNYLEAEMKSKADYKETITSLDEKANIDDVNTALIEIHNELDARGDVAEEQKMVRMLTVDAEKARWYWRSGYVKNN